MIPSEIRTKINPYHPKETKLRAHEFIGRDRELENMREIFEQYKTTLSLKNYLIFGEKSIGKSSLLHRFSSLAQDYNFIVYKEELSKGDFQPVDDFSFFYNIINFLFRNYSKNNIFFDSEQADIWFSLTQGEYKHKSTYLSRKIQFPSFYANYKRGRKENLQYKTLEEDFEVILNELTRPENGMEINGLAIVIDEFQELYKNIKLLDFIRQLSENVTGVILISAGLSGQAENSVMEKLWFIRLKRT